VNVTLMAINSGVALAWVPLVLDWTLRHFYGAGRYVPPPTAKILEVATIIVLPVVLGMIVRRLALGFALRAERPVRLASIVLLAIVVVVSIYTAQGELLANFAAVGLACLTFNLVSMSTGYLVPRAVGLEPRQAIAISFEIGVHNAAIAIYVAYAILNDPVIGVPAALYGLIQLSTASLLVYALRRQRQAAASATRTEESGAG
jgi:bile acid:Na+ symporter, BASS family